jgi:hypothetical protein
VEEVQPAIVVGKLSDAERSRATGFRYRVLVRTDDGNEMELGMCEGMIVADTEDEMADGIQRSIVETLKSLVEELESRNGE